MPREAQEQQKAARIDMLIQEIADLPDQHARATAEELTRAILDMYGEGLARLLEITAQTAGVSLIETFASDELLASLFLLHGLHPLDIETRILRALDEVRPYLKTHGGNVEFVKVEDGTAHLRLNGSCHGCPGSTNTLQATIEEAIYKVAPDLEALHVEGVTDFTDPATPPSRQSMPVTFVPRRKSKGSLLPIEQRGAAQ